MRVRPRFGVMCLVLLLGLVLAAPAVAGEEPSVKGTFTANGTAVSLPYVYVYQLEKGFYNDGDPTWKLLFVEHPIAEREVDEHVWDSAYLELGITKTAEFGDEPTLQVYSQSICFSADTPGNVSGGTYPELVLESTGPERFAGRVYLKEPESFFDDTVMYDLTFSAPLSNPDAPIGPPLPEGGGEPGAAYLAWVEAVHSGDLARVKGIVPAEMASEMEGDDAQATLEFLAAMTPTEVKVLGGSSDGETAILKVAGVMDGEAVKGEITMQKMGEFWIAKGSSW